MKHTLYFLFALLLLAPVTGELFRIPVWKFDFLPSDLIIPMIFALWGLDKLRHDPVLRIGKIGKMTVLFLFAITLSYFLNFFRFDLIQMKTAFTLLGRFGMYVVVSLIAFDLLDRDAPRRKVKPGPFRQLLLAVMILSMVLIALLGFLQLKYFPSFLELGLYLSGWDPHVGRLLSTWFDPNFIGGYLAFILSLTIALALYFRHKGKKVYFYGMTAISLFGLTALYFTFSRSGALAMMLALGILAFFKSRKLLIAGVLTFVLIFSFSPRMQERGGEAVDSAKALLALDSQKPLDPTAELRVWSWQFAREIIHDYPFLGAGFGRYPYEINARGHGLLSDHSSGGSDSSLLTIWASTGIFGLLTYLSIAFVAAVLGIRRAWKKNDFHSYVSAGLLAGFGGMMVHSVFVNSLLFALMMVYLWVGLALMDEA